MTLDPAGPVRQTLYATTVADLTTAKVVARGNICTVGTKPYIALPPGSVSGSSPNVVAGIGVDWVIIDLLLTSVPWGSITGYPILSTSLPLVLNGGSTWNLSGNGTLQIQSATTSSTGVVQLTGDLGGTGTSVSVLKIRGTTVATAGGALPSNYVLITTGPSTIDYGQITNLMIASGAGIAWGKLSGYPTITCTAPLTIDSGGSADLSTSRTLAVTNASTSAVGVVKLAGDLGGTGTSPTVVAITGSSNIAVCRPGLSMTDVALQSAPSAGSELFQAYSGQLLMRAGGGYLDYALSPVSFSGSSSAPPKTQKVQDQFQQTTPATSNFTISTGIFGQAMPANRELWGVLIITQRLDSIATSGWASLYIITAQSDGSGNIPSGAVQISSAVGSVGPGTVPTVSVNASGSANFVLSINNGTYSGALTGLWFLEFGWCGS